MEDKPITTLLEKEEKIEVRSKPVQKTSFSVNLTKLKQDVVKKEQKPIQKQEKMQTRLVEKGQINFFGTQEIKNEQPQQVVDSSLSSVIEKPNYDFIEPLSESQQKKIFKVERSKRKKATSPLLKKISIAVFVLLVGVLGSWTVYNAVELSNVAVQYNLKLDQYLMKLGTLDSASSTNDLFETYPTEDKGASSIEKQSNWFDRFCNFIARFFGG